MYNKQDIKNPAKWSEAKALVSERKGRGEAQFTDEDWLEVKRIYGSQMNKSSKDLEKIMGLSHSLVAPQAKVGGAALEADIKTKTKKLKDYLKKKKLDKSDYQKLSKYKNTLDNLANSAGHIWDMEHVLDGTEDKHDGLDKSETEEAPKHDLSSPEALKSAHGKKVFVYFNLHKKVWSVKDHKTGKVIAHAKKVSVDNPTFKVSEAGRQRVLAEKKKNVHAGVVGSLNAHHDDFSGEGRKRVSYNPYKAGHFYESGTDNPVHNASHATLHVEEKQTPEGKAARIPHVFAKDPKANG